MYERHGSGLSVRGSYLTLFWSMLPQNIYKSDISYMVAHQNREDRQHNHHHVQKSISWSYQWRLVLWNALVYMSSDQLSVTLLIRIFGQTNRVGYRWETKCSSCNYPWLGLINATWSRFWSNPSDVIYHGTVCSCTHKYLSQRSQLRFTKITKKIFLLMCFYCLILFCKIDMNQFGGTTVHSGQND